MSLDEDSAAEYAVYARMVGALANRDFDLLADLLAEDVELRSYATAGELHVGRENVLAAIKANRHLLFDPVLRQPVHVGDGWMIVPARLRHSLPTGGMADSEKTILARVADGKVAVSLVFRTAVEARAEHRKRIADAQGSP